MADRAVGTLNGKVVEVFHAGRMADMVIYEHIDNETISFTEVAYVKFQKDAGFINEETGLVHLQTTYGDTLRMKSLEFDRVCKWRISS